MIWVNSDMIIPKYSSTFLSNGLYIPYTSIGFPFILETENVSLTFFTNKIEKYNIKLLLSAQFPHIFFIWTGTKRAQYIIHYARVFDLRLRFECHNIFSSPKK